MRKVEFLDKLSDGLGDMPKNEKNDILFDYEEHFNIGVEEGRSEEEIAESLGEPKQLAKQVNVNFIIDKAEEKSSIGNVSRAVFATLGLGFFNIVFLLGPFIGLAAIIGAIWVVAASLIFAGVVTFISTFLEPLMPQLINIPFNPLVSIFVSIGITSLGFLAIIGSKNLTIWFKMITVKYLKMNASIIKNKK